MSKPKPARIRYSDTTIPPERTKADIEKMLRENGIHDIQWTTYQGKTNLKFLWHLTIKGVEKDVMFEFKPPTIPSTKRQWTGMRYEKVHVNLEATAYRLLWHYLKNKLEAVRWGLETMEREFLSHAVVALPGGSTTTVGDQIQDVLETVRSPALTYQPDDDRKIVDITTTVEAEEEEPSHE
jgi:hypothetical protein